MNFTGRLFTSIQGLKYSLFLGVILLTKSAGFAQTNTGSLAIWNFYGNNSTVPTFVSTNLISGVALTVGAGDNAGYNFPSTNVWDYFYGGSPTRDTNMAAALAGNHYAELTVTPKAGQVVEITGITLNLAARSNYPTNYVALYSSIDGYTSVTNQIGSSLFITSLNPASPEEITFGGLDDIITNTVTYRLYFYGPSGSNYVMFGNSTNPNVNAITLTGIPEAKTGAMLILTSIAFAFYRTFRKRPRRLAKQSPR